MGFCWGVWAGFKFASKYDGFKGFVGYHPSLALCKYLGED
jgi:dienelactone hydrolase